jgi:F0F1-type ATP synthase assembly protein I
MRNNELMKYAGLASQLMATLGVAFFVGYQADQYFNFKIPIVMISLPLAMLIISFWKIIKDSNPPKK